MAITNLTGTTWRFNETLSFESGFTWNINFNSVALVPSYMGGGEKTSFTQLKTELISYMGNACGMSYWSDGMSLNVYQAAWNSVYANENSRTIEITGGADVENADLIAFLQANAEQEILEPPTFSETKTVLKIYEDLSQKEFEVLEKEANSFYLVNGVGLYKGEKLIATNVDTSSLENSVSKNTELINDLNIDVGNLQTNKQDKLTAGVGIAIENNTISATGGVSIYEPIKEE